MLKLKSGQLQVNSFVTELNANHLQTFYGALSPMLNAGGGWDLEYMDEKKSEVIITHITGCNNNCYQTTNCTVAIGC